MKKAIVLAACLFSLTTTVNAQEAVPPMRKSQNAKATKPTPEQRAQKHVDELTADVGLTEDQKPKIYDLALVKVKKTEEIRAKYKTEDTKQQRETELKAVKKEFHQGVKGILTPEQLEKLKTKEKDRDKKGQGKEADSDNKD